jgi:hypothetical protein
MHPWHQVMAVMRPTAEDEERQKLDPVYIEGMREVEASLKKVCIGERQYDI